MNKKANKTKETEMSVAFITGHNVMFIVMKNKSKRVRNT